MLAGRRGGRSALPLITQSIRPLSGFIFQDSGEHGPASPRPPQSPSLRVGSGKFERRDMNVDPRQSNRKVRLAARTTKLFGNAREEDGG